MTYYNYERSIMTSSNIGFYDPAKELRPLQTGDTPLEFVYPFFGLGCFSLGIYLESYHTCGCASRAMFLTSNWEQLTCKPARYPNSTNSCCTTNETKCECFWPPTFFKFIDQILCLDLRIGLPCDDDVPFFVNCAGYTCFYKNTEFVNKWCVSFKELKDFHDAGNPQSVNGHQVLQAVPATVPAYESQPVGKY